MADAGCEKLYRAFISYAGAPDEVVPRAAQSATTGFGRWFGPAGRWLKPSALACQSKLAYAATPSC